MEDNDLCLSLSFATILRTDYLTLILRDSFHLQGCTEKKKLIQKRICWFNTIISSGIIPLLTAAAPPWTGTAVGGKVYSRSERIVQDGLNVIPDKARTRGNYSNSVVTKFL